MTDCELIAQRLTEAQAALHQLQIGGLEQTITFGSGKSVTYTITTVARLQSYVIALQNQVDVCNGRSSRRRAPIRMEF